MPRVIRLYIKSALIGFFAAAVFVFLILWFNVANLGHLVTTSDVAVMAVTVFWVLNGIVFSGVQFAWAVTAIASRPEGSGGGGAGPGQPVPVATAAKHPKPQC